MDDVVINITEDNTSVAISIIEDNQTVAVNINQEGEGIVITASTPDDLHSTNIEEVVEVVAIEIKEVGQKGDKGEPESYLKATFIAGEILGGQRLVSVIDGKVFYYNYSDNGQLGFTMQAVVEGVIVDVVMAGVYSDSGFNLIQNSTYYAASNGIITATIPNAGTMLEVGYAINNTTIKIDIKEPYYLL